MPAHLDPQSGFDHGLIIPLKLMYPQSDIPSLQLSLLRGLDPAAHIALGATLRELMHENILVVGFCYPFTHAVVWRANQLKWYSMTKSWVSVQSHSCGERNLKRVW